MPRKQGGGFCNVGMGCRPHMQPEDVRQSDAAEMSAETSVDALLPWKYPWLTGKRQGILSTSRRFQALLRIELVVGDTHAEQPPPHKAVVPYSGITHRKLFDHEDQNNDKRGERRG